ncbi:MAG: hypothetical protein EAY77_07805 [Flavobacteriia bacterium]|nr:MAG: hypothetical protein EAY77_07805 [Flavobacteriia bacterium]
MISNAFTLNVNMKSGVLAFSTWNDSSFGIKVVDIKTDSILFSKEIKQNCFTKPKIFDDKLCFPESNEVLCCYNFKKNLLLWELKTKGRVRELEFIKGNVLLLSIDEYGVIAVNPNSGKIIYELLLNKNNCLVDLAPTNINYDDEFFYLTDFNCNSISAYEIGTGVLKWSNNEISGLSNSLIVKDYIFLGTNNNYETGQINLFELKSGKKIFTSNIQFESMMNPVLFEDKIYFYTYDSKLYEFNSTTKKINLIYQFSKDNDISGSQIFILDNFLYIQDVSYNLNRINLNNFEKMILQKDKKGLLGIYKIDNKVKFIY